MDSKEKQAIIGRFKHWFHNNLVINHKKNTEKLVDVNEFDINPFLLHYLANYLEGNSQPESLAKALIYPRVLGTSITTTFGTMMQKFTTEVLAGYGSSTSGIDLEFIDNNDGRKKYCQLKSGPNSINKDDVKTITDHFRKAQNLARRNDLAVGANDFIFCLIYGEEDEKNSFVRQVEKDYVVYIGKEFWSRFTGDENFYKELILAAGQIANDIDMRAIVEQVIQELSPKIEDRFNEILE